MIEVLFTAWCDDCGIHRDLDAASWTTARSEALDAAWQITPDGKTYCLRCRPTPTLEEVFGLAPEKP